jgi:hypothetical protein
MASWELQLISRIVKTGELNKALEWGITASDFLTNEGNGLFQNILGYYTMPDTQGSVLGPYALEGHYPGFVLCDDPAMTLDALCTEVRKTRLAIETEQRAMQVIELCRQDPMAAIGKMGTDAMDLQNIGMTKRTDVAFTDAADRAVQRYELTEKGVDLSVAPFPWEPLQTATMGLQKDDYVVIYGRPKSMKSWVVSFLLAWFYGLKKRMLIYTKEMTPDNIFARVLACIAELRYQEFRGGGLTEQEKLALYAAQRFIRVMNQQTVVCLSGADATEGGDTVPWLRSKVEKYKPDLVFIDGLYLMSGTKRYKDDHARVRDISRAVRRIPLDYEVPVVGTIQANREAAKHNQANLDEIAFSDAIGQDATLAMRVINEKNAPTLALVVGGSREYHLNGFRIYGVPATNFEYAGPLTDREIESAKEHDVGENDGQGPANGAPQSGVRRRNGRKEQAEAEQKTLIDLRGRMERQLA